MALRAVSERIPREALKILLRAFSVVLCVLRVENLTAVKRIGSIRFPLSWRLIPTCATGRASHTEAIPCEAITCPIDARRSMLARVVDRQPGCDRILLQSH